MNAKKRVLELINALDFEKEFLIDSEKKRSYSYKEFFSSCILLTKQLQVMQEVDTIVAVMKNGIRLTLLYFAIMLSEKKIVVIDPEKGVNEIQELLLQQQKATYIIEKKDIAIEEISINFCDGNMQDVKSTLISFIQKRDFSVPFLITYTSGTSGNTKGVIHSLDNIFLTAYAMAEKLCLPKEGSFLHIMPMTYMAGILNSIFFPFILGYKIVLAKRFSIQGALLFWKRMKQYNINLVWVSPAMLAMIEKMDRAKIGEEYCAKNRICFLVGTAPLSSVLRKKIENRYQILLQTSYGLSETLFISVETKESIKNTKFDNVGEILEGVTLKILDDGELLLKVPWMYKGYTNEATEKYYSDGFYKTGDLVEYQEVLSIVGRKKDLIIKGGMNISPAKIEDVIMSTGIISETAVFGKMDNYTEERVYCAYVPENDCKILPEDIETLLTDKIITSLGKNYRIDGFICLEQLPRNINGKVDKNKLSKL